MLRLDINFEKLVDIIYGQYALAEGSYGKVFKLTEEELLKLDRTMFNNGSALNYQDVKEFLQMKNTNDSLFNTLNFSKQQEELHSRQKHIKKTSLPLGLAYYHDLALGIILKYHKKHKLLCDIDLILSEAKNAYWKMVAAQEELMDNYIYATNSTNFSNAMYSKEGDLQLIDFDGPYLKLRDNRDLDLEKDCYKELYKAYIRMYRDYYERPEGIIRRQIKPVVGINKENFKEKVLILDEELVKIKTLKEVKKHGRKERF